MGNNMRLGKGLEALLGNVAASAPAEQDESKESVRILSINQIDPNPYQPRQEFDEAEMQELADSIAMHGVIQPILVTSHGQGRYTLVAGERRWRASRKAGLSEIPAIVRSMDDRALREIALIENLQRVNLNPVEEAESISLLMQEYGLTQENVSERVGKSRSAVANALRLLSLPPVVLQMVRDGKLWISRGASVAVFPEGTRSKDGEIHRFKAGAFTLAREAGVEILPVVLDGTKTLIRKNAMFNWGNRITIRVLPPVPAGKVVSTETHVLMEEVHDAMSAALAQIRNRK